MSEPAIERGWVAAPLRDEFPFLGLMHVTLDVRPRKSPPEVRERLREMSNRFTGGRAVQLRREPVPWAYRVFFRQIGIDPDHRRTPPEEAALERLRAGGFQTRNLVDDALLIATVETGVALAAFDADRVQLPIGLRLAESGERLGGDGRDVPAGQIVIADQLRPLAVLFADMSDGVGVTPASRRMLIAAIRVKGVPEISVDEALWTVTEVVTGG
ncbi:MAG TPA: phenylalanine--tRNA ligase beta subunit-related protein [Thermoleophilaceae bacterium]